MASKENYFPQTKHHEENGELTVQEAVGRLGAHWRTVVKVVAVCMVAGLVYVLGSRSEYSTGATLLPEKQGDGISASGGLGMLQQLGGLVGGIGGANLLKGDDVLPVELYPEILASTPVQWNLLQRTVATSDGKRMTLFAYLAENKPFDLWESMGELFALGRKSEGEGYLRPLPLDSTIALTTRQAQIVEELRDRLDANYNIRTGILSVTVDMPDPTIAAATAHASVEELTQYIVAYRLQKLRKNLAFIEQRHTEARNRFNATLDDLARFRDQNQHLARDLARTEEQRLQAEYDLAFNIYNSLSTRLEEARIQLEEETPVFQVLEPVTVPLKKSYPPTALTLLLCGLLGAILGTGIVIFRDDLRAVARSSRSYRMRESRSSEPRAEGEQPTAATIA